MTAVHHTDRESITKPFLSRTLPDWINVQIGNPVKGIPDAVEKILTPLEMEYCIVKNGSFGIENYNTMVRLILRSKSKIRDNRQLVTLVHEAAIKLFTTQFGSKLDVDMFIQLLCLNMKINRKTFNLIWNNWLHEKYPHLVNYFKENQDQLIEDGSAEKVQSELKKQNCSLQMESVLSSN